MIRIDQNTVRGLFHVKINVRLVQQTPQASVPGLLLLLPTGNPVTVRVRTNEDQIEQNLEEPGLFATQRHDQPKRRRRNDPCPCGSGKKFKKCHGA